MKTLFFTAFLFLSLLCAGFLLFLPYLTDRYLLPRLTEDLPFSEKKVSLSRISPWKLRGTITIADNGEDILSLPAVEIHYSPRSILKGEISTILIDGGTLNLNLNNGKQEKHGSRSPLIFPIACDNFIIKNSSIILHREKKEHLFVINGRLAPRFKDLGRGKKQFISATTQFHSTGELALSAKASLLPEDRGYRLLFTGSIVDISAITHIFPKFKKDALEGNLLVSGSLGIDNLMRIPELQMTAHLAKFKGVLGDITLTNLSPEKPISITVKKSGERILSDITNLFIASPQQSSVEIQGEYSLKSKALTGRAQVGIPDIPLPLKLSFSGNHSSSETQIEFNGSTDSFSPGKGSPLFFSPISAKGKMRIRQGSSSGNVNVSVDSITLPSKMTKLQGVTFSLPIQFPLKNNGNSSGTFEVNSIHHNHTSSGSLRGKVTLNSTGIAFSGDLTSIFGPDLRIQCSGNLTMDKMGELSCFLPKTHIDSASFPPFINVPQEISIAGDLSAKAELSFSDRITGGKLSLQFNEGTIDISENQLSSIDIALTLPDLPKLQSEPSQLCTIGSIEFGKIRFSDTKIHFHLENAQSIFIEKSVFSWCDGKVESGGFRLLTAEKKLETTLYCDRLRFTELLSQFGIEDTEGEGSLNGKLPLLLSENNLIFNDGFLFSTPGDSGIIRFNNTSQLRQGMGDIDQTPYLDYSMQALGNFSYNWTKLTFNSLEENLLIKMQIDGKPAMPLPFGYRKGHIVPSEKGSGLQHPIILDVNFRLPVTHLFQYGKNMQSIMENM